MNNHSYKKEFRHSGVLGMHWGERKYQNEDGSYKLGAEGRYYNPVKEIKKKGKEYQKKLNKEDQKIAEQQRKYDEVKVRQDALKKKLKKRGNLIDVDSEGNEQYGFTDSKRDQRAKKKFLKNADKMQKASQNMADGKKEVERLLKEAKSQGYTIKETEGMRNTNKAKDYVGTAIGVIGTVSLTSLAVAATMGTAAIPAGSTGAASAIATATTLNRNNRKGTYYNVKYKPKNKK